MRSRHLTRIAALAAASALLLAGCSSTDESTDAAGDPSGVTITMGQQGGETEAIFEASGAFADAPYKVEYATFASPADTLTALATGNVDIGNNLAQWTATQGAAAAKPAWTEETAPYRNILVNVPSDKPDFGRFVVAASAQSGIENIEDAKGKKWGFLPGSSTNLLAAKVLQKLGWTFDDVESVSLDSTNQVLALETGQVDVLFNPRDNIVGAIANGATVLGTAADYDLNVYTGYLANTKSLDDPNKAAALEDFSARLVKAQDWYVQNPEAAQRALVDFRKVTPEQAKTIWEYTRVLPTAPNDELKEYSQQLADTALEFSLLKNEVDATVLLDDRFADTIDKTLADTDYAAHFDASYATR
ncbi:ABC transporter substrate-binding protein [Rhodococcus jostii]|uniref:ABC transporter substrate-binding protein n=1 Tax=Rhodococcus jostii TaxID=132919 RepID=UPI0036349194